MSLNETPKGNRIHIGIFGRRNAGKSSLINALTGQDMAIVSDTPGTTTDPVSKAMELHPIGPVVFIDTAGFDDEGSLGERRVEKTREIIDRTDIAVIVSDSTQEETEEELQWLRALDEKGIPVIRVRNKIDLLGQGTAQESAQETAQKSAQETPGSPGPSQKICVSTVTGEGIEALRDAIAEAADMLPGAGGDDEDLLPIGVSEGSLVLLVMPQDRQAPKGRLILPQVQTIRALLDKNCTVISTTSEGFVGSLKELSRDPDLIITDSQCFGQVACKKKKETPLTSFSLLMAKAKGDIEVFIDGAKAIDDLKRRKVDGGTWEGPTDVEPVPETEIRSPGTEAGSPTRILIAEACTHVPQGEDIGTVKIPRKLRELLGEDVEITNVRGNDFPGTDELKNYDLIIHCGACMFNRAHVMSRIAAAKAAGVPITNYGVFLAKAGGILEEVTV